MSDEMDIDDCDFIAHVRKDGERKVAHPLNSHSLAVSSLAGEFAATFEASAWAALAGLWHDLGKHRPGFQHYIRRCADLDAHIEGRIADVDKTHSAAGALWAIKYLPQRDPKTGGAIARVMAYLIAGHHAGLGDWQSELTARFNKADSQRELEEATAAGTPKNILKPENALPDLAALKSHVEKRDGSDISGRFALWVRMLFSCLVDADFLDTERFMAHDKSEGRDGFLSLDEMAQRLAKHLENMACDVSERGEADSAVNRKRRHILQCCLDRASEAPGFFSLTVPTGGGKTLSSLAFALNHARHQQKRRIIYAIPYTSIIEQTAGIFRDIFGEENVVEHHSSVEVDPKQETHRSRLACENWDAPLIVTTNVQLLESLFASRTSRCRKLHNLVGSVIVLDEAQLLPVDFLQPVVDVLRLLVQDYGVSVVLCTATQPALESGSGFDQARGLRSFAPGEVREIIDNVSALYDALRRVRVHRPAGLRPLPDWLALAPQLAAHEAMLAIVSRRADARDLYKAVRQETDDSQDLWHLSGLMCARHRSWVIERIKASLTARRQAQAKGETPAPVRVISTQLVEAGVDIDFPVVYRALAGLDSIAQAAGRCNREGRLAEGQVYVFVPPKLPPPGLLRMAEGATRKLWGILPPDTDPLAVEHFTGYFQSLYADAVLDKHQIEQDLRFEGNGEVRFRSAAKKFRLIDEKEGATVFVRYYRNSEDKEIDILLTKLQKEGMQRWLLRELQGYGVSVYADDLARLLNSGDVLPLGDDFPGIYIQSPKNDVLYHPILGLNVDGAPGDPGSFIK